MYLISIVAAMLNIHPQTLRQYEKEGLVVPTRSNGKMRLYSQEDIEKIKLIMFLTREKGVNLAGVEIILRLKNEVSRLECEMHNLRHNLSKTDDGVVPVHKSLVVKKSVYEMVVFNKI